MELTWQEILKLDKICPFLGCGGKLELGRGSTCGCPFMECDKCGERTYVVYPSKKSKSE